MQIILIEQKYLYYHVWPLTLLRLIVGWRGLNCKLWEKNPQVHLIIVREWPKNTPPILRNLDNFLPSAFYSTPLQSGTKEHNTYLRSFQNKGLHNIFFINQKLYLCGTTKNPLCSYCNTYAETPIHLFCECDSTKYLWLQSVRHSHCDLTFPALTRDCCSWLI